MNPVILFRHDYYTEEEMVICQSHIETVSLRAEIPKNSLVIPRYSALPYYNELEKDVSLLGSKLINSYEQFNYIANFDYYEDIKHLTFKSYFHLNELPEGKSFVVKGKTNSRKHEWDSMMFAKDKATAWEIGFKLQNDGLIGRQEIIYREYEPLVTYEILLNGLPATNEFRFFFVYDTLLSYGYYWSNAKDINKTPTNKAFWIVREAANIISKHNNFFTIDVAQKVNGDWVIVEVNSGEMSGLSLINPVQLYENLKLVLNEHSR